ncbi:DUF3597 domain-containing protein [Kaistia nematophila]|uniref:DUF3597 domain-containing protein n=1 Tax=Kaistia nematophila TaxID=2994654 RepID=A0A9X3DXR0_9HYPH|nr:DUF3597 domain-containing protein [Kaistia nematophila]MBN9026905.1 DUF3597 domain-containing protein [Hyphomicrobiales bacterium]MCX5567789.1 DUF3597 domain-containing protein [Kaistia nematophila]
MSRLSVILNKIFKSGEAQAAERAPDVAAKGAASPAAPPAAGASPAETGSAKAAGSAAPPQAGVDVVAVLTAMAAKSGQKLDWKKSIVDLLKLLDLDSSLAARKELASELHYTGDGHDSAAMNIWLHKAVMQKLAENGGKVPDELKH